MLLFHGSQAGPIHKYPNEKSSTESSFIFPLDDHYALISQNKENNYLYVTKFVDLTNSGHHNLILYASPNPVIKSRPEIPHQEFSKTSITGDGKSHPRCAYKPTLMADLKVFQECNRIPKCKIDLLSRVNHQYLI